MRVRTSAAIAAGVCGGLFVAYCIYLDKKRRSDPAFKEKLRERKFSSDGRNLIYLHVIVTRVCNYHVIGEFDGKCLESTTVFDLVLMKET